MPDDSIPIGRWGKDHWSTFAYIAHWCAEYGARGFAPAEKRHRGQMRADAARHPALAHHMAVLIGPCPPTRLRDGEISGHDDYDCASDAEAAGLIRWAGTGVNPVFFMTDAGLEVAAGLRAHKTRGGNFGDFVCRPVEATL